MAQAGSGHWVKKEGGSDLGNTLDLPIMPGSARPALCTDTHHVFQFWVGDLGTGLKTQEPRQDNTLRDLHMDPEGVMQPGLEGPSLQRSPSPSLYSCGHWCSGSLLTGGPGDSPQAQATMSSFTVFGHTHCSAVLDVQTQGMLHFPEENTF